MEELEYGKLFGFSHPAAEYNTLSMILLLAFTDAGKTAQMKETLGGKKIFGLG